MKSTTWALAGIAVLGVGFMGGAPSSAWARVTRLQIDNVDPDAFGGQAFGSAGPYEVVSGRVFGELDPNDPHNAIIQDLRLAPRNARGRVEYSSTFSLSRPRDMSKASGVLIYQVANRGGGAVQGSRDGHLQVISGWQGDIVQGAGRQTLSVPRAKAEGPVLVRFVDVAAGAHTARIEVGSVRMAPAPTPVSLETSKARLTWALADGAAPTVVPASDWAFADCAASPFPGRPDPTKLCLKAGFDPKRAYTLSYLAKDPLVLGIGYAAIRDLVAFLKYADADQAGAPNPAKAGARFAVGTGVSQSANVLRSLVHLDQNISEDGRVVFDGVLPSSSLRQNALDFRFAVPGGGAALYDYGTEGIMWWGPYQDRLRAAPKASLLDRCTASRSCPKVIEMFGGSELWDLRGSPALVGTDARRDIPLPANVRRYFNPGVTHTGGRGGFSLAGAKLASCLLPSNPNPASDTLRALTVDLIDWVAKGIEPPPSAYPTLGAGQLADPKVVSAAFPHIPGVPAPLGALNPLPTFDYGPTFHAADLTGVMALQPPRIGGQVPLLVATVDADGNETAGVRSVLNQAPLGSYVGWNYATTGYAAGLGCGSNGGFIPFAATRAERVAKGDPRPSLEERYGSRDAYLGKVRAAAEALVARRLLLPEDAARIVAEASQTDAFQTLEPARQP